ncbi:MAG: hypothetical protein GX443_02665 [Deltaproteobacteria bacterium]|nr:hypothetical protein [Deltaproteobacteria bacterium]
MRVLGKAACMITVAGWALWAFMGVGFPASGPVMVEKNLFAQDRKPTSSETATAAPQANKPGLNPKAVQLDGVLIQGETKKAIIRFKGAVAGMEKDKSSPFSTVREGEKIGEYQVVKIEPKSISLEKDGETIVVNLFAEGKVSPPVPPVPTSPAMGPGPGSQGTPQQGQVGGGAIRPPRTPRAPRPSMPQGEAVPPGMGEVGMLGMPHAGGSVPEGTVQEESPGDEELTPEEAPAMEEGNQ